MNAAEGDVLVRAVNLRLHYRTARGIVQAVDGANFTLDRARALVVLGESGCGKSSLSKAILRLLPRNTEVHDGSILFEGRELMTMNEERFRSEIRWRGISFVPQASLNALNPVIRISEQVAEAGVVHFGWNREEVRRRARTLLDEVGIPPEFHERYPFELSGGMRQRAAIAMALSTDPPLVILDEPTSALDVLTQANILNTLKRIRREKRTSFILITHDIGTSSEIADEVAVMYAGEIIETSTAARFFQGPSHPYSRALLASVPRLRGGEKPSTIPGSPPSLIDPPKGCRFAPRCPLRYARCEERPPLIEGKEGVAVRCWLEGER